MLEIPTGQVTNPMYDSSSNMVGVCNILLREDSPGDVFLGQSIRFLREFHYLTVLDQALQLIASGLVGRTVDLRHHKT